MRGKYNETVVAVDEYIRGVRQDQSVDRIYMVTFGGDQPHPRITRIYDGVPIQSVNSLAKDQYDPRGGTPLYDAMGQTLRDMTGARMFVVVVTDGQENTSQEYDLQGIKDMINEREAQGWDFIFLGADIDAWGTNARGMGIARGKTVSFSGAEMALGMQAARRATADYSNTGERLPDDYFEQASDEFTEGYFDPANNS
jgi:Mg-chelatase subunit ChlD